MQSERPLSPFPFGAERHNSGMPDPLANQPALSVAELTAQIKGLVEESFPSVWVTGEVSNFARPASGHCYFTLKDQHAQIRAVIWKGSASRMRFDLTDGLEILCHGRLDLYAPRGSYQIVIDQAQPKGVGSLELALRQLKEKLAAEGLFDADRKRPLPSFPRRVGFVTSPTGAAIRDFLEVARRRWSGSQILVIPTRVQGEGAAEEIAAAVRLANQIRPPLDVLVVGRGGGSIEDLWCFNEAAVIRAVAASQIPTVSAVGHEIDVTLCDLAADVRALTPSEAAERVVPSGDEFTSRVRTLSTRLHGAARRAVQVRSERVDGLAQRRPLARPYSLIQDHAARLDELQLAANRSIHRKLEHYRGLLRAAAGRLQSLSPLAVLARGYSITQDGRGQVVRDASRLKPGDRIGIRFATGKTEAIVD
ncbi:Exodeoxyribonuclease 7 large subunit [Posidoniimonas polymericola]|uniref:Exodeoxyribonuclease 7 large subunit n=2 Tax=Posidoniimonas polymericola TaxID=2528002 RepID=A0A5C5YTB7_9BACT|nr:Exodeoxyribonuclease 7 large subunit [Posidoniimonas polymericola]